MDKSRAFRSEPLVNPHRAQLIKIPIIRQHREEGSVTIYFAGFHFLSTPVILVLN